jgi:hypothetical protein
MTAVLAIVFFLAADPLDPRFMHENRGQHRSARRQA